MKNLNLLLFLLSLVTINILTSSQQTNDSQDSQEMGSQQPDLSDADIAWLFSENNPANHADAHISSFTNDDHFPDAQIDGGYNISNISYQEYLARLNQEATEINQNGHRPHVVSDSDNSSDDESLLPHNYISNSNNQRRRIVSPDNSNRLHRTYHVSESQNSNNGNPHH